MPSSDHVRGRASAATARSRSIAIVLGTAALSFGASVFALVSTDRPPTSVVPGAARIAAETKPIDVAATVSEAPQDRVELPKCRERPLQETWPNRPGDCVTRAELRANSMHKPDQDVVPPPAPAAAETPKQVVPPAAVAATTSESAIAAPEPKRAGGVASQAVPLPRPAPRPKTMADEEAITPAERERLIAAMSPNGGQRDDVKERSNGGQAASARDDSENRSVQRRVKTQRRADVARGKSHGRQRVAGSYPKRGPLKVISMLFGGWRR